MKLVESLVKKWGSRVCAVDRGTALQTGR